MRPYTRTLLALTLPMAAASLLPPAPPETRLTAAPGPSTGPTTGARRSVLGTTPPSRRTPDPSPTPDDSPGAARSSHPGVPWACPVDDCRPVRAFAPPAVRWGSGHRGVDLRPGPAEQVRAPNDGRITYARNLAGRPVLVIAHGDGLRSTFEPVLPTVPVGSTVPRGAPVGTVAEAPRHCPPALCLHWGVLRGDEYLDPLALLGPPRRVVLLPVPP